MASNMKHAVASRPSGPAVRLLGRFVALLEGMAFWTAAAFPFVHLGAFLLYARESLAGTTVALLVAVNLVAIVVGHRYDGRDR